MTSRPTASLWRSLLVLCPLMLLATCSSQDERPAPTSPSNPAQATAPAGQGRPIYPRTSSHASQSASVPDTVTLLGNLQSELGCPSDDDPTCPQTRLTYDASDDVWQMTFLVPAGTWSYRMTLNGGAGGTYGRGGLLDGPALTLQLAAPSTVKFYYDNKSRFITASTQDRPNRGLHFVATAPGSYQSELGCPGDWQPDCLRSLLQDLDGDGIYTFSTTALLAGPYEVKVAINESWDENYGAGGARNGPNISFSVPSNNAEVTFRFDSSRNLLSVITAGALPGDIHRARAHWLGLDTLAWQPELLPAGAVVRLHYEPNGALQLTPGGVQGGQFINLTLDPAGLPPDLQAKFPHLASYLAFKLPTSELARVPELLRGQLAISLTDSNGNPVDATGLQLPGVLDELYTYNGPLGVTWSNGVPTLRVWAPTARDVKLALYSDSNPATPPIRIVMDRGPQGVWSVTGQSNWRNQYYLYEVQVYVPSTRRVEVNPVTDPYSVSLSTNSLRSQLVDLNDPALKPSGWDTLQKPPLAAPEDIVLYELHVRDFSINDTSVPAPWRGTFMAFTDPNTRGMQHLARLASAGLTHVHLLPAFDFSTVNEDRAQQREPEGDLASMPPDSEQQQAAVYAVRDMDGFNWGYDPQHYNAPEGSYAVNPDGASRTLEFRRMVQGLSGVGLRTVMDVVYNHTSASGQSPRSVLDRVVPGYYHRLNADGTIANSTCCENTATEHAMMEKLMVDSVVLWARAYKVDGFRFDLMGHHMKANMLRVRQALDALTLEHDGVDGSKIYLYGEGWNFGEVANGQRGVNATQLNMPGTGIGTFSDRLRDAARGGNPFGGLQEQGFINGLFYDPNSTPQGSPEEQRARLLYFSDLIRVGLAGNLADYQFINSNGDLIRGRDLGYGGQPAGYTLDPQEVITYVSAHDNETLFDAIQLKSPSGALMDTRVRMHNMGMSVVALGQGIPFFHAGDELLRSKSLDRNSYNSGDWFNKLDFSYLSNNWGVGLPPEGENGFYWPVFRPLLARPELQPQPRHLIRSLQHFEELLRIRKSARLFRLRTAEEIQQKVRFDNVGPNQVPGLIVMRITDPQATDGTTHAVVLFNANDEAQPIIIGELQGQPLQLHPVQASSTDSVVRQAYFDWTQGLFVVPARTTAVFVNFTQPPPGDGGTDGGPGWPDGGFSDGGPDWPDGGFSDGGPSFPDGGYSDGGPDWPDGGFSDGGPDWPDGGFSDGGPSFPDGGFSDGGPSFPDGGFSDGGPSFPDGGFSDGGPSFPDGGFSDGGPSFPDGGFSDGGPSFPDGGFSDGGPSFPDGGYSDAGPGFPDAGFDAGGPSEPDAGSGFPDAGFDAGGPSEPDAGPGFPDAGFDAGGPSEPDAGSGNGDAGSNPGTPDSGTDAGSGNDDAGTNPGTPDASTDAGSGNDDAGTNPGTPDASTDAGSGNDDAGTNPGTPDASTDAGSGTGDAGTNPGTPDAGSGDAGTSPPPGGGSGCNGCSGTGSPAFSALALLLGGVLFTRRRRPQAQG